MAAARTVDDVQHDGGGVQVGGHAGVVSALFLAHLEDGEGGRDGLHVRALHLHLQAQGRGTCVFILKKVKNIHGKGKHFLRMFF